MFLDAAAAKSVHSLPLRTVCSSNRSSNGTHDMFMSSTHVCHGGALPRQRAPPSGLPAATIGLGDLRHAALMKAMVVQNKHPRTSGIKFDACAPVWSISRASGEFIILKHPSNLTTKISADTSNSHNKAVGLATPCRTGTDPPPKCP